MRTGLVVGLGTAGVGDVLRLRFEEAEPIALHAPPIAREQRYPFKFTGNAGEYFRLWIVNLLLSIVTLGIYSAWAKVRKKRYFYGNTWMGDSNFDFHGNPFSILKGRIIAVIALAIYSGAGYYSPRVGGVLFLLLVLASPWFIARALAFNARYSSYREIRFRNTATARDVLAAVWPFLLIPLAGFLFSPDMEPDTTNLTAMEWVGVFLPLVFAIIAYPYTFGAIKRLEVSRAQYGHARFEFSASISAFYKLFVKAYLIGFLALLCFVFLTAVVIFTPIIFIPMVGMLMIPFAYLVAGAATLGYLRSRIGNLVFRSITLAGEARFESTLSAMGLARIYLTNLIVITLSLGLLVPWAAIRVARYRAECLALTTTGDLESFVGQADRDVSATGEEVGEFFDLDLSL